MTLRTLFNIILKIFAFLFIKDLIDVLLQLLSVGLYLTKPETVTESIWTLLFTLFMLAVYVFISYILLFRTNVVIDKLKLDKGFDEETISVNIHRSTILSIAIIVIGGYMVVDEIPNLCRRLFSYYQERRLTYGQTNPSISTSVLSGVKIIIGFLLMWEQRAIVNLIERQRKR